MLWKEAKEAAGVEDWIAQEKGEMASRNSFKMCVNEGKEKGQEPDGIAGLRPDLS